MTEALAKVRDELGPDAVTVQIYAEPGDKGDREVYSMARGDKLPWAINGYEYVVRIPAKRPAGDYTPRVIPVFAGASVPLEAPHILWYR